MARSPIRGCCATWPGTGASRRIHRAGWLTVDAARQVTLFLSDPFARLPSFPRYGTTVYPFPVALKIGTSQGYRDAWTVAWSQAFMVGVWIGRAGSGTMTQVTGARAAAALAKAILLRLHDARPGDLSDTGFPPPDNHVPVELCAFTGRPGPSGCSQTLVEWLPAPGAAAQAKASGFFADETANSSAEPARLSIISPKPNDHLWRNPEVPASLDRLVLKAVVQPHVTQIVSYVDGEPFGVAHPDELVYSPIAVGAYRFQIRLPFEQTASKPVRIVVE